MQSCSSLSSLWHYLSSHIFDAFLNYYSIVQVSYLFNGPFFFKLVLCLIIRCTTIVTHLSLKCRLSGVSWVPRALELGCSVGEPLAQEEHLLPSLCSNISGNFISKANRSILCPVYLISKIPASLV